MKRKAPASTAAPTAVPVKIRRALASNLSTFDQAKLHKVVRELIMQNDAVASRFAREFPLPKLDSTCLICETMFDHRYNGPKACELECEVDGDGYDRGECPECREWDACGCGSCRRGCGAGLCESGRWHGPTLFGGVSYCYRGPHVQNREDLPEHLEEEFGDGVESEE
mmetsp:Transcript_91397/g.261642  ORF Transcript_91397/g.261642 Transcript_91397/m.261642 type:complete len:168 (+) Transcript_91397:56-559(+)